MTEYRISNAAKEDLRRIYVYGVEQFGEALADEYFHTFFATFKKIAHHPYLYQSIDHTRPGYRRCPCGADNIYYRIKDDTIEIMAILDSQDTLSGLS
ncbi:type II toxin-antitoxin system RelE/ParE family toxin [Marinomonas sp. A79]|uniref:Type II toxin-antitoxin system RelE/ParE family toxin n=1 Tax=Marinomonas vulgaris TaxID=2823372 RepID=A0ABS5H7D3_9GAMM|nr:type II toxin-antitoxin system RelE/ParE family toxin [Marinomonas vulgaris]MBR7887425.1 type II toxin-antitoxin system RelE/ParE family toxin [Marinomonas vulgaris]